MGYDSRKTRLVEPPLDKFRALHWELATRGYVVALKTVRQGRGALVATGSQPKAPMPTPAPQAATEYWTPVHCEKWAGNAKPHVKMAIRALAADATLKSTAELNKLSGGSSGGAITGGLNAWATRNGLPMPLVKRAEGGRSGYAFVSEELRVMFEQALRG